MELSPEEKKRIQREKFNAYRRQKYATDEEFRKKKMQKDMEYQKNNPDKVKKYHQDYFQKHKERLNKVRLDYYHRVQKPKRELERQLMVNAT